MDPEGVTRGPEKFQGFQGVAVTLFTPLTIKETIDTNMCGILHHYMISHVVLADTSHMFPDIWKYPLSVLFSRDC